LAVIQSLFYFHLFLQERDYRRPNTTSEITAKERDGEISSEQIKEKDLTKGNRKGIFWSISIFATANNNIFMQFFSVFACFVGVTASVLGFLTSIRNLLQGLFQGAIGRLSDRFGRKYILLFGFVLSFLIPIPLIFYHNTYFLIFVAIIQAFSVSIIIPTWNAVLGDVTEPSNRGTFIGKITSIGRLISVSVTLAIAGFFAFIAARHNSILTIGKWTITITEEFQYGFIFALAAFNALLCIISVLFLKETRTFVDQEKRNQVPKLHVISQDKKFRRFLLVNSLFGLTMSLIWPINPIILNDYLKLDFPKVAVMTSSFAVFIGVTMIVAGKIVDKIGRKPFIIISVFTLVFFPVSMIPAILTGKWWLLLLSRFVGGVGTGINMIAINAYTLDLAPNELFGGYSGIRETFYGIATFAGSLAAGFIIDAMEVRYGLYITVLALSIGVTLLRMFAALGFLFISESLPIKNNCNLEKND